MNLTLQKPQQQSAFKVIEQQLTPEQQTALVQAIAKRLKTNLIAELSTLSLATETTDQIIQSIQVEVNGNDSLKLCINSPLAAELEFGTRAQDEQPWMLRAIQKTKQDIKQLCLKRDAQ